MSVHIEVDKGKIAEFCERHHIIKLSLFGSVISDDFREDSDVDVLVEYDPERIPHLIMVIEQEEELSEIFGRKVDLRTAEDLSKYFREDVLRAAVVQYGK